MALFSDESSLQPGPQSSYAALGIALHSGAQLCADGGSWHKGGARRGFLAAVGGKPHALRSKVGDRRGDHALRRVRRQGSRHHCLRGWAVAASAIVAAISVVAAAATLVPIVAGPAVAASIVAKVAAAVVVVREAVAVATTIATATIASLVSGAVVLPPAVHRATQRAALLARFAAAGLEVEGSTKS